MRFIASVYGQYLLETLGFGCVVFVALFPWMKKREPRKVLVILVALNVLRFGGVAGALAALRGSSQPAFLIQVAVGDGIAATLAATALVLLLGKSDKAGLAVVGMNVVGLLGIVASETWVGELELVGSVVRHTLLHAPTLGAALYTVVHALVFYFVGRARREVPPERLERYAPPRMA